MEKPRMDELAKLMSEKQKAFCDHYITTLNATEAAKMAGYSEKSARAMGSENLTKPYIKEYIDLRLAELEESRVADATEVLQYLTRVMRGEEKDQFDMDASLQDRTRAAELLGKRYRLFVDKQEIDAKVEPITIVNDIPRRTDGG
jgi:phage terminase small subunit|nr:MAG TPA: Terminase small subunit [Caudoviricetes sp.]